MTFNNPQSMVMAPYRCPHLPERKHRALGMCDPCYQRHRYWIDPEKNREAARRSVSLARLKAKGVPVKVAKQLIELREAERNDD